MNNPDGMRVAIAFFLSMFVLLIGGHFLLVGNIKWIMMVGLGMVITQAIYLVEFNTSKPPIKS